MEGIKTLSIKKKTNTVFQNLIFSVFNNFKRGKLSMELPDGSIKTFGNDSEISAQIKVENLSFFRKCALHGDIGFGESYTDGDWSSPDVTNVVKWAILNVERSGVMSGSKDKNRNINWMAPVNKVGHFLNNNTLTGSKKNIEYHYDLSNDFYQMMLDKNMLYSCGYFSNSGSTLNEAQNEKLNKLCQDLDIKENDHILEIGCGWGSFAIHAVKNYECRVTGITISKEQLKFAKERIKEEGLEDKIEILYCDYRELKGKFDKIVSIEMIEAVGHEYLPIFFEQCEKLLKPGGALVLQVITSPDSRYESFRKGTDWIQKYIFPGSLLPSVGALNKAVNKKTELHLLNLRDIGLHYAKTLKLWRENFWKNIENIKDLGFDEEFIRRWHYYLCYCEAAFFMRNISNVQITYTRPNNREIHYEQI